MQKDWVIYALKTTVIFYIGRSFNLKRRLNEHRKVYGKLFTYEILESGTGEGFSEAEQKWIARFLDDKFILENKTAGGNGGTWLSIESREKVAKAVRGRKCMWGDKIGAAMKGKPKAWSDAGSLNVQSSQFKKGQIPFTQGKTPSQSTRDAISKKVSLSLIGNKRRTGIPHTKETKKRLSEASTKSGNGTPELMSSRAKKFWEEITPEKRQEFILKREQARQKTLKLKRINKVFNEPITT